MIYFVGGGVGTADYLTVAAFRILQKANVVLYSKYLDKSVLDVCKKHRCEMMCFSDMQRDEVNALLMKHHKKLVVYVANGDFAYYGTVQDHFDYCKNKNLDFKVIPGISALSAVASVTANEMVLPGVSNSVVVTYMESNGNPLAGQTIQEWARHNATLVIHMVEPRLYPLLKQRLLEGGIKDDVPVVIVTEALRQRQKVVWTTVGEMDHVLFDSWMSLVLVGNVFLGVNVRNQLTNLPFVNEFRKAERFYLNRGKVFV